MNVHLVDGTYELFRHFYGAPPVTDASGRPMGAVRGVVVSVLVMLEEAATHVGVATDHVIESFRNELWPGYKTGEGIDPDLLQQFEPLEDALEALGVTVWRMERYEADDALASAAVSAAADPRVEQVFICTPDKDLAQMVEGRRIVQFDRRAGAIRDADGVRDRFGVDPASIPDYLALMGDSADGFPGLRGWGAKSSAAVLARYGRLEAIPGRCERLGRRGAGPRRTRSHFGCPPGRCPAVPQPRDAPIRPAAHRLGGRVALDRPHAGLLRLLRTSERAAPVRTRTDRGARGPAGRRSAGGGLRVVD